MKDRQAAQDWSDRKLLTEKDLSTDQAKVARAVESQSGPSFLFVTGKAGTGKSALLRFLADRSKHSVVLAPTGIAALNVGGQTIHSMFLLEPGPMTRSGEGIPRLRRGTPRQRLLQRVKRIIVDEVSMVRADLLDAMDFSLRLNTGVQLPFGGKQVVALGDLWQLEPVVTEGAETQMIRQRYKSPFFFDSEVLRELRLQVNELTTPFRQQGDMRFLELLDRLRRGDGSVIMELNERVGAKIEGPSPIVLTATNARAQNINLGRLAEIHSPARRYVAHTEGNFGRELPTDANLALKVGAQVMFVKNSEEWVNGSLGTVETMDEMEVQVRLTDGKIVTVEPATWEKKTYSWDAKSEKITQTIAGKFEQLPLKLAWALTIHKSQGLTFDQIIVDFDRPAFAHGQTYVALSRCRTLDGVSLTQALTQRSIVNNPRVREFEWDHGLGPD